MGDKNVVSDDNKKIIYIDSNNLYIHSMSQSLPNDKTKFDKIVELEDILNAPDDSDNGCFVEVDLLNPNVIKEKTENFPFCPEKKLILIFLFHI